MGISIYITMKNTHGCQKKRKLFKEHDISLDKPICYLYWCEMVIFSSFFPRKPGQQRWRASRPRLLPALLPALLLLTLAISPVAAHAEKPFLMLATTTSTDNTGLLDVLAKSFVRDTGIELRWVAVGTGKALKLGQACDVDALLVHAPGAEKAYVKAGHGVDRVKIMYNDFVVVGPTDDSAKVKGASVTEALQAVASAKAVFLSRGDDSGTHKKELSLWRATGLNAPDKEPWYVQTGQGMLPTLLMARERSGYILTDRATFIAYAMTSASKAKGGAPLAILVEKDPRLLNQYSVMAVNPARCPKAKRDLARTFSEWLASAPIQRDIGDFRLLGKQLFTPNAN